MLGETFCYTIIGRLSSPVTSCHEIWNDTRIDTGTSETALFLRAAIHHPNACDWLGVRGRQSFISFRYILNEVDSLQSCEVVSLLHVENIFCFASLELLLFIIKVSLI